MCYCELRPSTLMASSQDTMSLNPHMYRQLAMYMYMNIAGIWNMTGHRLLWNMYRRTHKAQFMPHSNILVQEQV